MSLFQFAPKHVRCQATRIWYMVFWFWLNAMFAYEASGVEHIPIEGPVMLAGNHTGWFDTPMVVLGTPRDIRFIIDEKILHWPLIGPFVQQFPLVPVKRGREVDTFRAIIDVLKQGEAVCIFPEGQLTLDGRLQKFHNGVALIQKKANVPVIPFAITGGFKAWPWTRPFPIPTKLKMRFGPPIAPGSFESHDAMVRHLKAEVERLLALDAG